MVYIKQGYKSPLSLSETEVAIKQIKDYFEVALANALGLMRVSAPLFVLPESGLNDNLNGRERPVNFGIGEQNDKPCEIVHSLAKWKRHALKRYGFEVGKGLYTDMNAIRRDEDTDNLHSIYVDQWDWELVIDEADRKLEFLHGVIRKIHGALVSTEKYINGLYPFFANKLPSDIHIISSQELLDLYPTLSPKERENAITKQHRAVFITQIGGKLGDGTIHDGRAPDYDDWQLNGDWFVYSDVLDRAVELSSMGIRVNAASMRAQLAESGCEDRAGLPFHSSLLKGELPQTIGGGIGQSRICMILLEKLHIGEVHASVWTEADAEVCEAAGARLL